MPPVSRHLPPIDDAPSPERPVFAQRWEPAPRRCPSRAHASHAHVVLAFHLAGSAVLEQRGRWSIGAGDVMLVPAGEPHRMIESEGVDAWGLGFCAGCLLDADAASLLAPFERVRSGASAVVRIPEARRAFLSALFAELAARTAGNDAGILAVQRSLLTLILAEVHRAASSGAALGPPEGLVADALRFIERRCLGKLSLRDVADAVHRSPAHVTTTLKRATGRSALQWILEGRLAEARKRLLHTDEQVEIIAERVGYDDPTHFIRLFRREHGLTPAAWRARHRPEPSR